MTGTYVLTPARRAALRKAQLASAARRRKYGIGSQFARVGRQQVQYTAASASLGARRFGSAVQAQRTFTKTKRVAKATRTRAALGNELKFYKSAALRGGSILTGAKPKSRANQNLARQGVGKRFVQGVQVNQSRYKSTVSRARKTRNSRVRKAFGH